MLISVVFTFALSLGVSSIPQECTNYRTLPWNRDRSRNNTLAPPDPNNIPCDDAFTGWYRLHSGVIATSCVPENHCGTSSPIWMKDPIPGIGQTRENKFCVDHKSSHGEPCCLFSFNINVTNCCGYLVYDLKGDDLLCPSGYCTENRDTCQPGTTSNTGFEPCTESNPVMDGAPILSAPVIINNGQDFSQTCTVNYRGTVGEFKLEWFFDGVLYKTLILTNGTLNHTLYSKDWTGHVGQTLECHVTSYYHYGENATHGNFQKSLPYFGGIKISPDTLTLIEGEPKDVSVIATLPAICSTGNCTMRFNVSINGPEKHRVLVKNGCSLEMKNADWSPSSSVTRITLATSIDPLIRYQAEYLVGVNVLPDTNIQNMWTTYTSKPSKLYLQDYESRICAVFGQSHVISTKQGRTGTAFFFPGDFMLYKDVNKEGNVLEVQVRLWKPNGHGASVCAVAVRYNEALVIVDMCTRNMERIAPLITQGDGNPDDLRVYLCGPAYRIVMGDGSRVIVHMHQLHMDVKVDLPPSYSFQGAEACYVQGFHITLPDSPPSVNQILPWLLTSNTSLFLGAGKKFFEVKSQVPAPVSTYCTCGGGVNECDTFLRIQDPLCSMLPNQQMRCETDCVLVVPGEFNPEAGSFQVRHPSSVRPPDSRWSSSRTYGEVRLQCMDSIDYYTPEMCVQGMRDYKDIFFHTCIEDYRLSGGFDYLESSALAFQWMCENELLHKRASYISKPDGSLSLTDPVLYQLCPGLCNEHGLCKGGTCHCHKGYGGKDCSIEINKPPSILGVKGNDICQMSNNYCFSPILVTRNVDNNVNLIVKVEHLQPNLQSADGVHHLEPVYLNHYSVLLPMTHLPSVYHEKALLRVKLSVSNDGKLFSNSFTYTVYDDKCIICTSETCVQQESACHIDGKCYFHGDLNPDNSNQICEPLIHLTHWTDKFAVGHGR